MEYARAGKGKDSHFCNHLYGTFTAAKERIIWAGRAKASASGYLKSNAIRPLEKGRARKPMNKRKRRSRKKEDHAATSYTNKEEIVVVVPVADSAVGFPCKTIDALLILKAMLGASLDSVRKSGNKPMVIGRPTPRGGNKLSGTHGDFGLSHIQDFRLQRVPNTQPMATVGRLKETWMLVGGTRYQGKVSGVQKGIAGLHVQGMNTDINVPATIGGLLELLSCPQQESPWQRESRQKQSHRSRRR
jgi:hypothetical protein